jgi:hypothetical protein
VSKRKRKVIKKLAKKKKKLSKSCQKVVKKLSLFSIIQCFLCVSIHDICGFRRLTFNDVRREGGREGRVGEVKKCFLGLRQTALLSAEGKKVCCHTSNLVNDIFYRDQIIYKICVLEKSTNTFHSSTVLTPYIRYQPPIPCDSDQIHVC